ncbi:aminotransferase class I/II-fold pyridoxal phosphate-dependent enzyme [Salinibacterium sp. UTAS2018]|uniref:aminotransferase class I/II-fold pyridoxal phosphate-dependent enzyme n=1 Tax=Salinibacterium sp. UTAS2018 TaxID=2508880 RepID=UPI001009657D|nr:aminotransferase class I/II-fold pyridoxal phosphate-dependent enzyme [Salinibacterium sp. UTAS2018]QAV71438.1 aminotransferase class I/II-fold pyridoxal phosphate-dependent enzyme [Salinibacterium sp. UTAS2018]
MTVTGSWERAATGAMLLGADGQLSQTIFAEMSALAVSSGAINLGQGFPDEDGPIEVLDAARKAISDGTNQYPPGNGLPVLRNAIAEHQQRFYGIDVDPDTEVLATAGATEALAATILALTSEGDEVITLEPFYDAYGAMINYARATHVTVPLRSPDFQPNHDDIRAAFSGRTRLIILNSPHNPTGAVLDRETLELIVELAHKYDALIVTDEVYEHITFGHEHIPVASLPGAFERTISISSGGKTFNTTGWKIGWITAPQPLLQAIMAVKQYLTYVNGAPLQVGIATGLGLPNSYFTDLAGGLARKRDTLGAGLRNAGFDVSTPQAGYFIVADAAPLGVTDAADFCRILPEISGVVGIPVTAFVHPENHADYKTLIRFAYCKKPDVLERAAAQLSGMKLRH